jgi:hypothetical protein
MDCLELLEDYSSPKMVNVLKSYNNNINAKMLSSLENNIKDFHKLPIEDFFYYSVNLDIKGIGATRKSSLSTMRDRFITLRKNVVNGNTNLRDVYEIMKMWECDFMKKGMTLTGEDNHDERYEFIGMFQQMYDNSPHTTIYKFFHELKENFGTNYKKNNGGVKLRTIHGSKGCTYPYVYLWCENIANPMWWAKGAGKESETFLFYVALTRASIELNIFHQNPDCFRFNFIFPGGYESNFVEIEESSPQETTQDNNFLKYFTPNEINLFKKNIKGRYTFYPLKDSIVIKTTEKAVLLKTSGTQCWVPKSQLGLDFGYIHLPDWLFAKNGLKKP